MVLISYKQTTDCKNCPVSNWSLLHWKCLKTNKNTSICLPNTSENIRIGFPKGLKNIEIKPLKMLWNI